MVTAQYIEIANGTQRGPARIIGQFGTRLDYTADGKMKFFVSMVDTEGCSLMLHDGLSYEQAIIEAEEAARDWGVPVNDRVRP